MAFRDPEAEKTYLAKRDRERTLKYGRDWWQRARYPRRYGITLEEFQERSAAQNDLCSICHRPQKNGRALAVDHDHATKVNRGLICHSCNIVLGLAEDSPERLEEMAAYLRRGGNW